MKRYSPVIMGTCTLPWTDRLRFDEKMFRASIRHLAKHLTRHLYIFGTAGEGYAITESQFEHVSRVFHEESNAARVEATLGIISLSLPTIVERIEKACRWGFRRFQISLPSWGALNDRELKIFFQETCGQFRDCQFMHYNLLRTKRLLTPGEYGRLSDEHENLIATKNTKDDEAFLTELMEKAPQLQHFLGEAGYARMRDRYECGLLISIASSNPSRAQDFWAARGPALQEMRQELKAAHEALCEAVGDHAHMDGAYDKLIYKLGCATFPLRLLPPYACLDDGALRRYQQAMQRRAPAWLPNNLPADGNPG